MEFALAPELEDFRRGLRRFFDKTSSPEAVRELIDAPAGFDVDAWHVMNRELDVQGLMIPPEHGGSGAGLRELAVVFEESGRALNGSPLLASAGLATQILLHAGEFPGRADLLTRMATEGLVVTAAVAEIEGRWDSATPATTAVRAEDGTYRLGGRKHYVLDAEPAALMLVVASTDAGPSIFLVEAQDVGMTVEPAASFDLTRRFAEVGFADTSAVLVGELGAAPAVMARALRNVGILLAAEQMGGARQCLEMSVEYAKLREQFGRPIGSFQAIKHKCADMLMLVESGTAAFEFAAQCVDGEDEGADLAASVAAAYCSDAFMTVAKETIQVHGGIGFTWEHPAHLYFRRAKSSQALFGSPVSHRQTISRLIDAG